MITSKGLEKLGFKPLVDFVLQDNGDGVVFIAEWKSNQPQPPEDRIHIASLEAQAEYEATEYQRDRRPEYPPIGDQLDALFHAGVFPEEMEAQLQAVKTKYPKD
jgi:hypothetical protein